MECHTCQKPAKLSCGGCNSCPALRGDQPITYYCDKKCQKSDWARHKPICIAIQDQTLLYRVAGTAQKLFFIFAELTYRYHKIEDIERSPYGLERELESGRITLKGEEIKNPNWVTQPQVFPSHLMESEDERIAVLSWNQCISAHEWMMEFVESMLAGIVTSRQILEVRTKNDKLLVGFKSSQGGAPLDTRTGIRHEILKVGLRSGVFAVDLTGAQCGYPEPVTPWDEYRTTRISEILTVPPNYFGHSSLAAVHEYNPDTIQSLKDEITNGKGVTDGRECPLDYILQALNVILMEWQQDGSLSLKDLWELSEPEFITKEADLIDYVHFKFAKYHLREEPGYCWTDLGLGKEHPWHTVRGKELARRIGGGNWIHYS